MDDKVKLLMELRNQISDLNSQVKELEAKKRTMEDELMATMGEVGLTLAQTPFGTVSISDAIVPNTTDWGEFEEFVYQNRAIYLFQRRLSSTAYREELKLREKIPGVEPFTKRTLSLRKPKAKAT